MFMKDTELYNELITTRNLSKNTAIGYKHVIKSYTEFHEKSLQELLTEAEKEEEEGIRWKNRKLKNRLVQYRMHIQQKHSKRTVGTYFSKILTIYAHFEIEIHKLPLLNTKQNNEPKPVTYKDLPDKEIIKKALKMATPLMRAVILFMSSSGCARNETLHITIQDFINATKDYHGSNNIYEVIDALKNREDIVPMFQLKREKTDKHYFTFCTPEATTETINYLKTIEYQLSVDDRVFKVNKDHLSHEFGRINDILKLGKVGYHRRFRGHMLRKFHASQLYNNGVTLNQVDEMQGRGKSSTQQSYFMEDPEELKQIYIKHMNCLTINMDVNNIDFKSPEYVKLENENKEKDAIIKEQEARNMLFDERLKNLENTANWNLKDLKKKFG